MEAPLSEPFFTRRLKMLRRPDGFDLNGKLGINIFSTSELLYPTRKNRLPIIRAGPNFYIKIDNPKASLGIIECSLYTRCIALRDDYRKKRVSMLAYTPEDYNCLETWQRRSSFLPDTPVSSNELFQKGSSSTNCHCNKYKHSIHWIVNQKSILVSAIQCQTT